MPWPMQGGGTPKVHPGATSGFQEYVPFTAAPVRVARVASFALASGVPLLASGLASGAFVASAPGTVSLSVWLQSGTATIGLTVDGTDFGFINQGNNMAAGAWYGATFTVDEGDTIDIAANAATTVGALRALFTPST